MHDAEHLMLPVLDFNQDKNNLKAKFNSNLIILLSLIPGFRNKQLDFGEECLKLSGSGRGGEDGLETSKMSVAPELNIFICVPKI